VSRLRLRLSRDGVQTLSSTKKERLEQCQSTGVYRETARESKTNVRSECRRKAKVLGIDRMVARARIVDCVPIPAGDLFLDLRSDPFATGPWCWLLETPIACDWALGLWRWISENED